MLTHNSKSKIFVLAILCAIAQPIISVATETKTAHHATASKVELDATGLPAQELEYLLRAHAVQQARALLANTPRHKNDDDARTTWMAACLSAEKDYDAAIAEFHKVKHLDNARGYVLFLAASAYAQEQDFGKARELCNLAISRDHCTECYDVRAACYYEEKRYLEAAADYEKMASTNRYASDFYCKAAQAMLKANEPAKALALVNKAPATENGSLNGSALLTKASCLERLNRWSDAVAVLNKGISKTPIKVINSPKFWQTSCLAERAKCYEKLGRKAEAAADRATLTTMSTGITDDLIGK